MSAEAPEPPPPTPAPPPQTVLGYRSPAEERAPVSKMVVSFVALAVGATLFASVPLAFGLAYGQTSGWPLLIIPVLLVALIALGIHLQRGRRSPSVAMGVWLGIGLALLAEGVCFAAVS